jgi:hypothetical protein
MSVGVMTVGVMSVGVLTVGVMRRPRVVVASWKPSTRHYKTPIEIGSKCGDLIILGSNLQIIKK